MEDLLTLDRCPRCQVARPLLTVLWNKATTDYNGDNKRFWFTYACSSCGGVVLSHARDHVANPPIEVLPAPREVSQHVPGRAKQYLEQAVSSMHSPAGAVMLVASSVDAMLKERGYKDGSLYRRIDAARDAHLITPEMAAWAHEIRLDANDQRHADEAMELPTPEDASRVVEFAFALAQFLYVLPAQVARGRRLE
jgi:hypothetical protein